MIQGNPDLAAWGEEEQSFFELVRNDLVAPSSVNGATDRRPIPQLQLSSLAPCGPSTSTGEGSRKV
jgi:hypothetical protein